MSKTQKNLTSYCVSCKKHIHIQNPHIIKTKNNRMRLAGTCPYCHHNVSRFISNAEAHGSGLLGSLLGMPNGKVPLLSDLPLVGGLF